MILACGLALESSAAPQQAAMGYLGSYIWRSEDPRMGGMSAIEVAPNGRDFTALSDRGLDPRQFQARRPGANHRAERRKGASPEGA
ncbi:hypothetical protein ACFSHQ_08110 [Gemmobacter lanyuensis]